MDRLAAGEGGTLLLTVVDPAGAPVDLDDPPTCQVVHPDGDPLGDPLPVTQLGDGSYAAAVDRSHPVAARPVQATAVWDTVAAGQPLQRTTRCEVIGGWPFTLLELRAANTDLADADVYPPGLLASARDAALERFERITGVAWSPRWRRVTVDVTSPDRIMLPDQQVHDPLLALTVNGLVWQPGDVHVWPWGEVTSAGRFDVGRRGATVDYLTGHDPCPRPVADAVLDLAVATVLDHGHRRPDRATAVTTDLGTFRVTVAGRDGPTGIPSVDAVAAQWGQRLPAVG